MIRILLLSVIMMLTPLGIVHAESNNTVWEDMNQSTIDSKDTSSEEQDITSTEIGFGELFKTIVSLILVIGLIFAIFYFIKKRRNSSFNQDNLFENIGGFPLGNQRSIQMIRMNDRIFILGVSESIQLIKEVNDPEEFKEIIHKHSHAESHFSTKFQNQLDLLKTSNKETISKLLRKEKDND